MFTKRRYRSRFASDEQQGNTAVDATVSTGVLSYVDEFSTMMKRAHMGQRHLSNRKARPASLSSCWTSPQKFEMHMAQPVPGTNSGDSTSNIPLHSGNSDAASVGSRAQFNLDSN
ncbi:GL25945 [Drosophila persimilis]|uniref:GL25945 n=1 Tax=Drosophila persimilis TaxID=7234 RepID=B4GJU2_DROPE|nr:GL25945 [Drosophila persimilis]